ncbi:MAG: hypothetical protein L6Q35_12925 [Phycisphaerales bacterium]|nr:hypothetical protein [Phycisphaerales bacterium]
MLDLRQLARVEEARLAHGLAEVANEARWLSSGGVVVAGAKRTWANTAAGLGLGVDRDPARAGLLDSSSPPETWGVSGRELDELVEWFVSRGNEPRIDVSTLSHPSLIEGLSARYFVVRLFETIYYRGIAAGDHPPTTVPGIEVRRVDPSNAQELRAFAEAVVQGFADTDTPGPDTAASSQNPALREDLIRVCERSVALPRTIAVAAFTASGAVAGGAGVEVLGDVAGLFGASVLRPYRRMGIQRALIEARLRLASERGARVATIGSRPGVATERNARRAGFLVGYTRVILARPGAGLDTVADS